MKTKIKNEFQNPDLIFGNENQNWKTKIKNENWFLFLKKLLTNRNQYDILIIETKNKIKKENCMRIVVTNIDTLEEVFEGDAEDFLADNSYDEDIELALCMLDERHVGSKTRIFGNFTDVFEIEKILDLGIDN